MDSSSIKYTVILYGILVLGSGIFGGIGLTVRVAIRRRSRKKVHSIVADLESGMSEFELQPSSSIDKNPVVIDPESFKHWSPLRRQINSTKGTIPLDNMRKRPNLRIAFPPSRQVQLPTKDELSSSWSTTETLTTPRLDIVAELNSPEGKMYVYQIPKLLQVRTTMEENASMVPIQKQHDKGGRSKVKLSLLLRLTFPVPKRHYSCIGSLDEAIGEIMNNTHEGGRFMRTMSLFHFVTIGSTEKTYDNPYFFTRKFHEAVDWSWDPQMLADEPTLLQLSIVDVLVCWCWNQWCCANGVQAGSDLLRVLAQAASMSPEETYHCVGQGEVMATLCLMYIGLTHFAAKHQRPALFKIATVIKACTTTAPCHIHRDIVPIFAQAVSTAPRECKVVILYECLNALASSHLQCCLEYRDLAPPPSDMLALLRHGLWTRQPGDVRNKAKTLAEMLAKEFPQITEWCDQETSTVESLDNVVAPGAWLMFRH